MELVSLKKVRYGYDCRVSWFKLALHEYEYEIVILHNEEEVAVGPARHPIKDAEHTGQSPAIKQAYTN